MLSKIGTETRARFHKILAITEPRKLSLERLPYNIKELHTEFLTGDFFSFYDRIIEWVLMSWARFLKNPVQNFRENRDFILKTSG